MKLSFMLPQECIVTGLDGGERLKRDVLADLVEILYSRTALQNEGMSKEQLVEALISRENELSTAVGDGFAFPHARLEGLKGGYLLLGVSKKGVLFSSPDNKPVNFFLLSMVCSSNPNLLLQSRAALMRFLLPEDVRAKALDAPDPDAIWEMIDKSGVSVDKDVVARDIMWPQIGCVYSQMTLKEAAIALHKYHCDSLPILDDSGSFLGDISCYDLFAYGLPNFFFSLKTISFIRHMDPFEKYFLVDSTLKVGEMKTGRSAPVVPPDATLMEIIFELTTHNEQHLYVVEDGRLLGIIDRFSIVDKVLLNS